MWTLRTATPRQAAPRRARKNDAVGTWCGGCAGPAVAAACAGSLDRVGVTKVHWECWSDCNLGCPFCFRTRDVPVEGADAVHIVDAVATGGARTLAFAGGDPSLRRDLGRLVARARGHCLRVEIQTNAQALSRETWAALRQADRVCLSLDGPTPDVHDLIRLRPGNHRHVVRTARELGELGVPITVRTVVTRENADTVPEIAALVAGFVTCERWTLLEFTPVNEGYDNRGRYELPATAFERVVAAVQARDLGTASLDVFRHAAKVGAYVQVTPAGLVYGTTPRSMYETGQPEMVGSLLTEHLRDLAGRIPLDRDRHRGRYADERPGRPHA